MPRSRHILTATLSVLAAFLLYSGVIGGTGPSPSYADGGFRFVDSSRLLSELDSYQGDREELIALVRAQEVELTARAEGIMQRQSELEMLDSGSDAYFEALLLVEGEKTRIQLEKQRLEQLIANRQYELMASALLQAERVAARLAQQSGYSAVFLARRSALPTRPLSARAQAAEQINPLYFDPALDVTDDLLREMNATPIGPQLAD